MSKLKDLKKHLKKGGVYRRSDLSKWTSSVDRHLDELLNEGTLEKLSQGLYYYPEFSSFGKTPPLERVLIRSFLKDDRFLLTNFNTYNALGVGTTQLYNKEIVYNHKRHGDFALGSKTFSFRVKPHFPRRITQEFLLVDLVNNLEELAEDQDEVLQKVKSKVPLMNLQKFERALSEYGNAKTKKTLASTLSAAHG